MIQANLELSGIGGSLAHVFPLPFHTFLCQDKTCFCELFIISIKMTEPDAKKRKTAGHGMHPKDWGTMKEEYPD